MTIIKSYTNIPQSKKLAEFLPLESADMLWGYYYNGKNYCIPNIRPFRNGRNEIPKCYIPAWSLAALLDVLESEIDGEEGETYQLNIEKYGPWWNVWYKEQYDEANPIETESTEELIDACVAMIIRLNELKML